MSAPTGPTARTDTHVWVAQHSRRRKDGTTVVIAGHWRKR